MAEQSTGWRDQLARYAKAIVNEAVLPAAEKLIPQGAAELSQALFTGNGYVPYGPTEKPVPMEASSLDGAVTEQPAASESELRQYVTVDPEKQQPREMESQSLYGPATAPEAYQPTTHESMLKGAAVYGSTAESELRQYVTLDPERPQARGTESSDLYGPATTFETYQPTTYESMLQGYAARGQEQQQALENER